MPLEAWVTAVELEPTRTSKAVDVIINSILHLLHLIVEKMLLDCDETKH